jgi:hypothetical protein
MQCYARDTLQLSQTCNFCPVIGKTIRYTPRRPSHLLISRFIIYRSCNRGSNHFGWASPRGTWDDSTICYRRLFLNCPSPAVEDTSPNAIGPVMWTMIVALGTKVRELRDAPWAFDLHVYVPHCAWRSEPELRVPRFRNVRTRNRRSRIARQLDPMWRTWHGPGRWLKRLAMKIARLGFNRANLLEPKSQNILFRNPFQEYAYSRRLSHPIRKPKLANVLGSPVSHSEVNFPEIWDFQALALQPR